LRMQI